MKFVSYGSNSSGNCYIVHHNGVNLGFDIGKNPFNGSRNLMAWKFLKYLFISHEHEDHTKYLITFLKNNYNGKIFINRKCYNLLKIKDKTGWIRSHVWRFIFLDDGENWSDETIKVTAFKVRHNSQANNGYIIHFRKSGEYKKIGFFTDCGSLPYTTLNLDIFNNCDLLMMELNHTAKKLPNSIKEEIQYSDWGHFSHEQAVEFLKKVKRKINPQCNIYLLHASLTNYNMEKEDNKIRQAFPEFNIQRVQPLGIHLYNCDNREKPREQD
ncbi:MBL fold metallo-hydrolase [Mycoplasma sp. HF14]